MGARGRGGYLDFRGLCTLRQGNWALTLCWLPDQSVHSSLELAEGGRREDPVLSLHHKQKGAAAQRVCLGPLAGVVSLTS